MYLDLEHIKKHLNIDEFFTDDDDYITMLSEAAELAVEKDLDLSLSDLEDEDGILPAPVRHAMLLLIGNLYNNREATAYSNVVVVPKAMQYLLDLYRDYKYKE